MILCLTNPTPEKWFLWCLTRCWWWLCPQSCCPILLCVCGSLVACVECSRKKRGNLKKGEAEKGKCFCFCCWVIVCWIVCVVRWIDVRVPHGTYVNVPHVTDNQDQKKGGCGTAKSAMILWKKWLTKKKKIFLGGAWVCVVLLESGGHVFGTFSPSWDDSKKFIGRFLMVHYQGNVRGFRGMCGRRNNRKRENESAQRVVGSSKNSKNIVQLI